MGQKYKRHGNGHEYRPDPTVELFVDMYGDIRLAARALGVPWKSLACGLRIGGKRKLTKAVVMGLTWHARDSEWALGV